MKRLIDISIWIISPLILLGLGGEAFYWRCVYWPITENAFSNGAKVGYRMAACGVQPSPELSKYLGHYVVDDIATRDCVLLIQEAKHFQGAR